MAELFYLPQMGQTMTEGTILKWIKQEGDHVEGWEGVVEMMTDKINMEVEPQITGTIRKILAAEGAVVPVGAPIAIIGSPDEDISALLSELSGSSTASAALMPDLLAESEAAHRPSSGITVDSGALPRLSPPPGPAGNDPFPNVSPRAREAAKEAGLDWKQLNIVGSGADGMIVERDVVAFLAAQPGVAPGGGATPLAAKIASDLGRAGR